MIEVESDTAALNQLLLPLQRKFPSCYIELHIKPRVGQVSHRTLSVVDEEISEDNNSATAAVAFMTLRKTTQVQATKTTLHMFI